MVARPKDVARTSNAEIRIKFLNERFLPARCSTSGNGKSDAITGGMIVGMTVYPWGNRSSKLVGINIVKISEEDYRDYPDLCMKIVIEALLSLRQDLIRSLTILNQCPA